MKRSFTILGLLATAAVGSYAQSVTLFGLVDVALERVSNIGPGGASLMRVPSLTGALPSRWGMRGTEDLGGGLRAVFTLEQGFAPDEGTPNQGGRAFGRQSFVGLAGDWGSFTVGRQYSMLFWSILDADVMGPALYGSGSLDSYIPNARADNALAYRGTFGGLTLGFGYQIVTVIAVVVIKLSIGQLGHAVADGVQKVTIMGNQQESSRKIAEEFLKPLDGIWIKVVGGLVQD